MHFLAISGLHVALLAACCWWTLGAFGVGLRATSVVVFLVGADLRAAERLRARRAALRHHVRRLVRRVPADAEDGFPVRHGAGAHPDPAHPARRPLQHRAATLVRGRPRHVALQPAAGVRHFRVAVRSAHQAGNAGRPKLAGLSQAFKIQEHRVRHAGRVAGDGAAHRAALRNVHADRADREPAAASAAAGRGGRRPGRRAPRTVQRLRRAAAAVARGRLRARAGMGVPRGGAAARRLRLPSAARLGDDPPVRRGLHGDGVSRESSA